MTEAQQAYDLLPKEIQENLPGLNETAELRSSEMPVIVKFFHAPTGFRWYIGAGDHLVYDEPEVFLRPDGKGGVEEFEVTEDWLLFGWCDLNMGFPELGYVSLNELRACHEGQVGLKALPVERDLHFNKNGKITLQDVIDGKAN